MAITTIDIGSAPDDGTGDPLRRAFQITNENFADLDSTKANETDVANALARKVDAVAGKGLSTADFTNEEKNKLDGVEENATYNRPDSETIFALDLKVDKVAGQSLMTDAERDTLSHAIQSSDLANTTDPTKGAALIGFDAGNGYGNGTLGAAVAELAGAKSVKIYPSMPDPIPMYELFMVVEPPDVDPPVVTLFTATTNTASPVPITSFESSDNQGVTGWWIGETSATPALSDAGWKNAKPTTYVTSSSGAVTLYARVRDAAGNISVAATQQITIPASIAPVEISWPYDPAVHTSLFSVQGTTPQTAAALVYTPSSARKLSLVQIPMRREIDGAYPGTGTVTLQIRSGGVTGAVLGSASVVFTDGVVSTRTFTFTSPIDLVSGTTYFLVLVLTNIAGGQALYRVLTKTGVGTTWADSSDTWTSYAAQSPLRLEF